MPLKAWTVQPLTVKTPGFSAIAVSVTGRTEFAGMAIDEMVLHSTSTPDVLRGISHEERHSG